MAATLKEAMEHMVRSHERMMRWKLASVGLARPDGNWKCAMGQHKYHRSPINALECHRRAQIKRIFGLPMASILVHGASDQLEKFERHRSTTTEIHEDGTMTTTTEEKVA